jgi:GTP-binding protein
MSIITEMFKIKKSVFVKSIVHFKDRPTPRLPEFAFVGRSNVGKSSLINSLLNRKNLAKVSKKPGKTRVINYFLINDSFYLVDLPGYGFADVPISEKEKWKKMVEKYLLQSEDLLNIWILIDVVAGLQKNDLQLIEWLESKRLPFQLVATKADKLGLNTRNKKLTEIREILKSRQSSSIFLYSARKNIGREIFLDRISYFLKEKLTE